MKNLILKELKLVISPALYLFLLLAALLVIPQYPYCVATGYCILCIFTTFNIAKVNDDHTFMTNLPVKRNDIVLVKLFDVVYLEVLQLIVAIPFAILSNILNKNGNVVGMDANIAYFGLTLIEYSVFNIIMLPNFFKTGYKIGVPVILGLIGYVITICILEFTIAFTSLKNYIDGSNSVYIGYKILVLLIGVVVYFISSIVTYKLSVKRFNKINI